MYDELTEVDIQKMKDEIDYRTLQLRPKLIEEVKVARGFGDLSENFEYKAAKREKNRNDSRIRYLQRMVDTAKVISDTRPVMWWVCSTRWSSISRTTTRSRRSAS